MKVILFMILAVMANNHLLAQKRGVPTLTHIDAKHNGISHQIKVGDVVHLGYGAELDGTFRFIHIAGNIGLIPLFSNTSGKVFKIKYYKGINLYQIQIKGAFGHYVVDVIQAIGINEIIGFNDTYFKEP